MVVDTSAFVAMIVEPDGERYALCAQEADTITLSAVTAYETRLVLSSRRRVPQFPPDVLDRFEYWLIHLEAEIVPFDADQAILAHEAYRRWGKGFHPAALNLADCAAYALSRLRREPLLFKGNDFALTDVEPAIGDSE